MKIKGAIFDLDGTILDSMHMWENLGGAYLTDLGIKPDSDINSRLKTMSLAQAAEHFRDYYGLKKSVDEIIGETAARVSHFYKCEVETKSGVKEFLEFLKSKNVKMCIATASDTGLVHAALEHCGINGYFCRVLTCTETGVGKDSPKIYDAALQCLGTKKEETVVFEDAYHAIVTAKNNGYFTVGVYDSFEKNNEERIKETADKFIYSFDELRGYFD